MVRCGVRLRLIVAAAALALVPARAAHAGLSRFGWLIDTDVIPERSVELEQWTTEEDQQGKSNRDETTLAWAPVVGITDRLELALPVEWTWEASDTAGARTAFTRFGGELRWRLVTNDPVDAPAFAPLVRLSVNRLVTERDAVEFAGDLVGSYHCGRVHAVANAGVLQLAQSGASATTARGGAGVSIGVTDELRLGAEAFAQLALTGDSDESWVAAGPDLAWSHGRFWIAASLPIGLYQIRVAPRITWAIAF